MPPISTPQTVHPLLSIIFTRHLFNPSNIANELRTQWIHPSDVFSVLLLLGGDVISRALAQLAGGSVTPVAFSFGV